MDMHIERVRDQNVEGNMGDREMNGGNYVIKFSIKILSHVGVTYKTGFELDVLHLFTTRNYRQYSTIAVLHTFHFTVTHALEFSVFTSRILATDLSQTH
jgi:hypothetical protein